MNRLGQYGCKGPEGNLYLYAISGPHLLKARPVPQEEAGDRPTTGPRFNPQPPLRVGAEPGPRGRPTDFDSAAGLIRMHQGGFCRQKHTHRNTDSKVGPGGVGNKAENQRKTTNNQENHRNSGTLAPPKRFLYQRPNRTLCYAIVPSGRTSALRARFWPDMLP